jgi:surface protein
VTDLIAGTYKLQVIRNDTLLKNDANRDEFKVILQELPKLLSEIIPTYKPLLKTDIDSAIVYFNDNSQTLPAGNNSTTKSINNINGWDTSAITSLSQPMFSNLNEFNSNIGNWNTINVTQTRGTFFDCHAFNQNIGNWNMSKNTMAFGLFANCFVFNQDISKWDVSKITEFSGMFFGSAAFNQNISNWNTLSATTMENMFNNAVSFNQDIRKWNISKVTNFNGMFTGATAMLNKYGTILTTSNGIKSWFNSYGSVIYG